MDFSQLIPASLLNALTQAVAPVTPPAPVTPYVSPSPETLLARHREALLLHAYSNQGAGTLHRDGVTVNPAGRVNPPRTRYERCLVTVGRYQANPLLSGRGYDDEQVLFAEHALIGEHLANGNGFEAPAPMLVRPEPFPLFDPANGVPAQFRPQEIRNSRHERVLLVEPLESNPARQGRLTISTLDPNLRVKITTIDTDPAHVPQRYLRIEAFDPNGVRVGEPLEVAVPFSRNPDMPVRTEIVFRGNASGRSTLDLTGYVQRHSGKLADMTRVVLQSSTRVMMGERTSGVWVDVREDPTNIVGHELVTEGRRDLRLEGEDPRNPRPGAEGRSITSPLKLTNGNNFITLTQEELSAWAHGPRPGEVTIIRRIRDNSGRPHQLAYYSHCHEEESDRLDVNHMLDWLEAVQPVLHDEVDAANQSQPLPLPPAPPPRAGASR